MIRECAVTLKSGSDRGIGNGWRQSWPVATVPRSMCGGWLNAVEGFFAELTRRRLQRGVFHSLVDLQAAINRYLAEHNDRPKPSTWTADPDHVIAAANRGYQVLDSIH
jgi:hypothetical protein